MSDDAQTMELADVEPSPPSLPPSLPFPFSSISASC